MKTAAIIQARMGSTRLPGKVLLNLIGRPMLGFMIERLKRAQLLDQIIVATSELAQNTDIVQLCDSIEIRCILGPEEDVLERYRYSASEIGADFIVRLTADCPLICPEIVDKVILEVMKSEKPIDYATNCIRRTYPRGLDTEVIRREALDTAAREAEKKEEREHVTLFIRRQPDRFRQLSIEDQDDYSNIRWTIDTSEDFELIKKMVSEIGEYAIHASYDELRHLYLSHPEWSEINAHIRQKEISS